MDEIELSLPPWPGHFGRRCAVVVWLDNVLDDEHGDGEDPGAGTKELVADVAVVGERLAVLTLDHDNLT